MCLRIKHCVKNDQYYVQIEDDEVDALDQKIRHLENRRKCIKDDFPEDEEKMAKKSRMLREMRNNAIRFILIETKDIPKGANIQSLSYVPRRVEKMTKIMLAQITEWFDVSDVRGVGVGDVWK